MFDAHNSVRAQLLASSSISRSTPSTRLSQRLERKQLALLRQHAVHQSELQRRRRALVLLLLLLAAEVVLQHLRRDADHVPSEVLEVHLGLRVQSWAA